MSYQTEKMCEALRQLQRVKTFDIDRAYRVVFAGIGACDLGTTAGVEWARARALALECHRDRMRGANDEAER